MPRKSAFDTIERNVGIGGSPAPSVAPE